MGYIAHKAMVIVGDDQDVQHAHAKALTLFDTEQVTHVHDSMVNGFRSFAILPRGSKAGWPESDEHDRCLALLRMHCRDLGLDWAIATFGGDVECPSLEAE